MVITTGIQAGCTQPAGIGPAGIGPAGIGPAGIGPLIRRYRRQCGLTQVELATAAGMSIGALQDLEQGRTRAPRWGTAEKLAAVLGIGPVQRLELARAGRAAGPSPARPGPGRGGWSVQVLGPLAVWRDGTPVALGSVRLRAVLGLLALHANVGLHRDTLIDLLWGHRPPASAVPAIQGYISRLRRVLGPGDAAASRAEPVTTVGGCSYRLNTGEGQLQLDLLAFRQLIRQAETAAQPDPARACDRYRRALGLWRGDVLADVDLLREHPAAVEAARQHADATIAYADAALGAGQPGLALPQLRRLCTTEPLNEQAHARLMTVLAAIGQQAAALQSFAALRQRLDSELGIFPSPVLTQAYADVLRQETSPRSRR